MERRIVKQNVCMLMLSHIPFPTGQLHLTPVSTAYQLRPGLKYLDRIDEKQKVANKKATEEENALKDKNSGKSVEDDNVAEGSSSSARAKGNKAIQV